MYAKKLNLIWCVHFMNLTNFSMPMGITQFPCSIKCHHCVSTQWAFIRKRLSKLLHAERNFKRFTVHEDKNEKLQVLQLTSFAYSRRQDRPME